METEAIKSLIAEVETRAAKAIVPVADALLSELIETTVKGWIATRHHELTNEDAEDLMFCLLAKLSRAPNDAEAERIRITVYLSYNTVYSDDFCVRCSHCPSNCECAAPVYMAGWEPDDKLRALKVALFQEDFITPFIRLALAELEKINTAKVAVASTQLSAEASAISAAVRHVCFWIAH